MPIPPTRAATIAPALALTLNAFVWGTAWWPMRWLQSHGLHPLWSTVLIYLCAVAVIGVRTPRAFAQLARTPSLWLLVLASGTTNAAFNWAVVIGDVVRVVLLFYLMPLWAVLLARLVLKEPFTAAAAGRTALALAGAAIVLQPEGATGAVLPLPRSLPDWLAVVGGFAFALNNVMLRRESARPQEARAMAMFSGGAAIAALLASALALNGSVAWPPPPQPAWAGGVLLLALLFLAGNLALQYGTARLTANVTAVVMLTEVVFASGSAVALGGGVLTPARLLGGALIVAAAALAAFERPTAANPRSACPPPPARP